MLARYTPCPSASVYVKISCDDDNVFHLYVRKNNIQHLGLSEKTQFPCFRFRKVAQKRSTSYVTWENIAFLIV